MIIGTAGHIDHGKTTLVKALTGVDCDRLKEEKARGITVDLGYAYTPLASGETLGFIDVPGHEKLIHNMLAGATGIDFALLVIAADDGPMPQTREHLEIVELLGIRRGAVALSKCDLVTVDRLEQAKSEIRQLLAGTALADAPLFPVAASAGPDGQGVRELRAHLETAAAALGQQAPVGGFRLAVDRCFTLSGAGTVVTGTAFAGSVQVGDQLLLSPSGQPVRVRRCTSSGPSISRNARPQVQRVASGVSGERPIAPKICMARSTTRCCRRAATTLMAATWARTVRASAASPWSSNHAACSTSRRAWSISMRDSASHSCTLACSASGLPNAVRSSARSVARESASSH